MLGVAEELAQAGDQAGIDCVGADAGLLGDAADAISPLAGQAGNLPLLGRREPVAAARHFVPLGEAVRGRFGHPQGRRRRANGGTAGQQPAQLCQS